ncbi:coiled-coil domain-containing protein [Helicobacter bilis]|uniref:hypothetical protein n=1 Tax=Helicobacter bilis TaxID=37372 RepID=UPI000CF1C46C|nr:hypothetical protein [Helicobacter bilis]
MISIAHKEITKDYGDSVIENVWVDSNSCHVERSETSQSLKSTQSTKETTQILGTMQAIKNSMLETLQTAQDSIICLYTSFLDPEIIKLIPEIAKNNRIYIYTKDQNTLQELSHHSLVRLGDNLAGSFVLIQKDKNIQGFFSTKDFDIESNQLFLELDSNQCNDFWHYFITCFWKDAKKEFIAGKEEEKKEMNQKDFIPPFQNGFDTEFIRDSILQEKSNALIQLQKNSPLIDLLQDFEECKFFLQDFHTLSDEMLLQDKETNFIECPVGFDSINNDIFLSNNNTLLYSIRVTGKQTQIFKAMLQNLIKNKTKSFKHEVALKELIDKTIHYLDGKTAKIEAHTTHIDSIQYTSFLDKDEFETQELDYKQIWQDKYPHTCEITYSFDTIPFYTPTHFKQANLYTEWENTHKALHDTINKALNNIESIYKKQDELNAFQALLSEAKNLFKRFFLGKNTNLNDLTAKLNEIKEKATLETLNIDSTQSYIQELEKHIKTINENSGEIDLKLDEAKEHNKWQTRKNELEEDIEKLQQHCHTKQQDLNTKEKECKDKEEKLDSMQEEIENLNKKKDESNEKQNSLQGELNKLKNAEDSKDKTKEIESKLNDIKQDLDKTTQTLDSKKSNYNKEKKDKEALDKYIDTEKQNLQKDENQLKNLKDELKTKYEKFSYNKKDSKESKSSLAFMDKTQSRTQQEIHMVIPKENRPTTGVLKEDKHERLLEISQWDEVESATEEAQRLKASLSVKHDKSQ